ncbi:MAG TPA: hypothetical protein VG456_01575 [Candidatus Sulfopaludibacter sp.]|jgi:hypothetical protein|nr:hypothetical protein [Candidatus Sulfopaludibacter sp.]
MRPFIGIATALGLGAAAALAQDSPDQQKVKAQVEINQMLKGVKVLGIEAGIMGPVVKGAPYSADEIHETTQVLADGTRIHNETKTTVYRDSQGRVRRESPGQVMIWDSASSTSYMLNESNQTAQKMKMAVNYVFRHTGPGAPGVAPGGAPEVAPDGANIRVFHFPDGPAMDNQKTMVLRSDEQAVSGTFQFRTQTAKEGKREPLGTQIMEGVACEGSRVTNTIDVGAIGNDRPIQSTEERWYSSDLQVNVMLKRNDPRTGEDTVRLTNVRRIEPDPSLFTVPSNYQMK